MNTSARLLTGFFLLSLSLYSSGCSNGGKLVLFNLSKLKSFVIGQPSAEKAFASIGGMRAPSGTKVINGDLYVLLSSSSRIQVYDGIPEKLDPWKFILAQPNSNQTVWSSSATSAQTLRYPQNLTSSGTNLIVADRNNNRIQIWNTPGTADFAPAQLSLGQPDLQTDTQNYGGRSASSLRYPQYSHFDGTHLIVADPGNARVLIWNTMPSSFLQAADVVLGQNAFTTATSNEGGISTASMNFPTGIWSDGTKLIVVDRNNHRVMIWNSFPTANKQAADIILGQPITTSNTANNGGITGTSMNLPETVASDGTKIIVSDKGNNRLLIWNTWPTSTGQVSDIVWGQADAVSNSPNRGGNPGALGLNSSMGVDIDGSGRLFISDTSNNRVLMFNSIPTSASQMPSKVIGQPNYEEIIEFNSEENDGSNVYKAYTEVLTYGEKFIAVEPNANRVLIFNKLPTSQKMSPDIVIGQPDFESVLANYPGGTPTQNNLNYPGGVAVDSAGRLYISDYYNHRVLIWNQIPETNFAPADIVLGQPDFTQNVANNGGRSAQSFNTPYGIAVFENKLIVGDGYNHRFLIWNTLPVVNQAAADVVIGQPDMTSGTANNGGRSAKSIYYAWGMLAYLKGKLIIEENFSHRVLIFDGIPTSNFASASVVLGQPDFTTAVVNSGGPSLSSMNYPLAFVVDEKLFVTEFSNHRILVWDEVPTTNFQPADRVLGQPDGASIGANAFGYNIYSLATPYWVYKVGPYFMVRDTGNQRYKMMTEKDFWK